MRRVTQLTVASGVAVLTLLTGCSSSDSSSDASAGGGSSETDTGQEQEDSQRPAPEETPAEDAARQAAAFDECGLFEPAELADIFGSAPLYATAREVYPDAEGGASAGCGYSTSNAAGTSSLTINTVAGTSREEFFEPFASFESGELADLGDHAEVLAMGSDEAGVHMREVRTIDGDTGLHIAYLYSDEPGSLPALGDAELGEAMALVAATALERMPQDLTTDPGAPEGRCAAIDGAQVADVLGEEMTMFRNLTGDAGSVSCHAAAQEAYLGVTLYTDPAYLGARRVRPENVTDPDIGDGAEIVLDAESAQLTAHVNVGEHVVAVKGTYASSAGGAPDAAGPAERDLVRAAVAAVTG